MYTRLVIVAVMLAAPGVPSVAQVEPDDSGFYVTPLVHAVRTDDERSVDDHPAFTLAAGFQLSRNWNAELNLFRGRFDSAVGDELQMDAVGVNALRVFRRDARIAPYALFGVGSQRMDRLISGSSTDAYADVGAGLLANLRRAEDSGRALFLRVELRTRYDDAIGASRLDHMLGIGLQYAFGTGRREPTSTPAPAPAPVPPAASDEDGDGDRVADSVPDECPRTPPGTRINARGCDLGTEIQLPLVAFEFDSDRLESGAFTALDEAIVTLRMNPDLAVEVAGHADRLGSEAYNLSLSQRRAETVRRYLVDNGVTNVLTARGYGESEPVADNGTAAGRAENRRVVLRILSQ